MSLRKALFVFLSPVLAISGSAANAFATPPSGDVVLAFDDPKSIVSLGFQGVQPTELAVVKSSLSMATQNPFCTTSGCTFVVNHLVVAFGDFSVDVDINGNAATFDATGPVALIEGPLTVQQSGSVIIIPKGTPTTVGASVSGGTGSQQITPGQRTNVTNLPSDMLITLDAADQLATIDGTIDFSIPVQGVTLAGSAAIIASNSSKFVNLPPVPNAGAPQTLTCPSLVTLNGSATTDPENNVIGFSWSASNGESVNGGPTAALFFGQGQTTVTLSLVDLYNSQRQATTSVTVLHAAPAFSKGNCSTCAGNGDCASFVCSGAFCQPPSCSPTCNRGAPCGANSDCGSNVCSAKGQCQPAACSPKCNDGATCGDNSDCESFVCTKNVCKPPSCAPTCNEGAPCGANTDCGSHVCTAGLCQPPACAPKCGGGSPCNNNGDCQSFVCTNNVCQSGTPGAPPACSPKCADGNACSNNGDCESFVCTNDVCKAPSCSPSCNQGAPCGANADCGSTVCTGGQCRAPACAPKCGKGSPCNNNGDCESFVCNASKCQ